jgi:hypothetical protein
VAVQIRADAAAIQVRAELAAQHVQHPRALRVGEVVEHLLRLAELPPHDAPRLVLVRENAFGRAVQGVKRFVRAAEVALPEPIVVGGKALVQPDLAPVLARHEVAEPLVSQLMRDEAVAAEQVLRLGGEERAVVQRGEAGVLHAAPVVVVDGGLAILRPRVVHANLALEKLHHVLGVAEGVRGGGEVAGRGPKLQRDVAVLVLDFLQLPGDQRDEVGHVRLLLHPMKRGESTRAGLGGNLATVRERDHAGGHMAGDFAGELLDGMVERREPMPRLARLALRPEMRLGITHLRRPEVEAFARLGGILHHHARLLPDGNRRGEGEDNLAVGDLVAE